MIFVSHRLDEVFALTDRVTVFCNGQHVLASAPQDMTTAEVVKAMIGRELVHSKVMPPEKRAIVAPLFFDFQPDGRGQGRERSQSTSRRAKSSAVVGQLGSGAEVLVEALTGLRG